MNVIRCAMEDDRALPLLDALRRDYHELYGPNEELDRYPASHFDPPDGTFVIVVENDVTIGGGGLRRFDHQTCEIKRVWTHPEARRRGVASAILDALRETAADLGYRRIVLETGPLQPAATALYDRYGFQRIPPFGPYPDDIGFELLLGPDH